MTSKRPAVDLLALTADQAVPMPEASQRMPPPQPAITAVPGPIPKPANETTTPPVPERVRTENLEALAFKVSPAFRRRFRQRAAEADLKLNELLFAALDAWEEKQRLKG